MDHNTTGQLYWTNASTSSSANGPIELITQLKTDTDGWSNNENIITPSNYAIDQSSVGGVKYTIDYSGYKARIITAQEIAKITGANKTLNWNEKSTASKTYYFYDLSEEKTTGSGEFCASSGCTYGWLYDRTATYCTTYGCLNNADDSSSSYMAGYWTSSSDALTSIDAWFVHCDGFIGSTNVNLRYLGVRPVIEVLKSSLK